MFFLNQKCPNSREYRPMRSLSQVGDIGDPCQSNRCHQQFFILLPFPFSSFFFSTFIFFSYSSSSSSFFSSSSSSSTSSLLTTTRTVKAGEVIQLERRGFFRCDEAYGKLALPLNLTISLYLIIASSLPLPPSSSQAAVI